MAKLVGTGKDPLGQYGKGTVFDIPYGDDHWHELIDRGWAEEVSDVDHPGRTTTQIANAMVRGDALVHPAEQATADEIRGREHDIVRTQDPAAGLSKTAKPGTAAAGEAETATTDGSPNADKATPTTDVDKVDLEPRPANVRTRSSRSSTATPRTPKTTTAKRSAARKK